MKEVLPCAIYTRKSSEEGLEQGFNSLDAQREACEAFILSQKTQGWKAIAANYDDGGFSGGNTERPALQKLLADIAAKRVRIIVVYKVDRLTRSLADFAKLVELFDAHGVSFVSVTQQFNTTSSMGRLTLNVLLSFAQFEREVTGERIRDKIAASKRKGMWMGGTVPIGYISHERTLIIDEPQAQRIREIYRLYLELGCVRNLKAELECLGWRTPLRKTRQEDAVGGNPFSRGHLYRILSNPVYIGKIAHKDAVFEGNHPAIVDDVLWNAVRGRMKGNLNNHQYRTTAAVPSLLAGLVFDDLGNRLTPTHTKKGNKHYRYYVTHELITNGRKKVSEGLRLPARELEVAVLRGLAELLKDESRLIGLLDGIAMPEMRRRLHHASDMAKQLSDASPSDKIAILNRILQRIIIHKQSIKFSVHIGGLWSSDHTPVTDEPTTSIDIPMELKRCGMAVRMIVPASGQAVNRKQDSKLIALLAKAHKWLEKLTSGTCDSIKAIALQEKVTTSYVTHVVYLAFLDPGIVHRILQGTQPPELSADRLIRMVPLLESWEDQRKLLGMII